MTTDSVNASVVQFHSVFPPEEVQRVVYQCQRHELLGETEAADQIVEEFISQYIDRERTKGWGPPDTSKSPMVAVARAMSTPGHYGRTPVLTGAASDAAAAIMAPLWPKRQTVEYMAWGMGAYAVLTRWSESLGRLVWDLVSPHHLWFTPHPDDPTEAIVQRHLRIRSLQLAGASEPTDVYTWDVWDLSGAEPSFSVRLALTGGRLGEDVTLDALGHAAMIGSDYPCWDGDRPWLPYTLHRAHDDGTMWGWNRGRGAFRGTLMSMLYQTHAGQCARNAAYRGGIAVNMKPASGRTKHASDGSSVVTVEFEAGDIVLFEQVGDRSPNFFPLDAGVHLGEVSNFAADYSAGVAVDMGVTPTDAISEGSNPMSGVAIHLTNAVKREEQRRCEPFCRAADMRLLRHALLLTARAGVAAPSPDGLAISYHEIPRSPAEEQDYREAISWRLENGMASRVDVFVELHPGLSRPDAMRELARIEREKNEITAAATQPEGSVNG